MVDREKLREARERTDESLAKGWIVHSHPGWPDDLRLLLAALAEYESPEMVAMREAAKAFYTASEEGRGDRILTGYAVDEAALALGKKENADGR